MQKFYGSQGGAPGGGAPGGFPGAGGDAGAKTDDGPSVEEVD
jgi:heat shock protein 1/8